MQDTLKDSVIADTSFKGGKRESSLYYQGEISSISIYSRDLSSDEVKLDAGQDVITPILLKSKSEWTIEEQILLKDRFYSQDESFRGHTEAIAKQQALIGDLKKPLTSVMVMGDVATMRPTYVLDRGNMLAHKKIKSYNQASQSYYNLEVRIWPLIA